MCLLCCIAEFDSGQQGGGDNKIDRYKESRDWGKFDKCVLCSLGLRFRRFFTPGVERMVGNEKWTEFRRDSRKCHRRAIID